MSGIYKFDSVIPTYGDVLLWNQLWNLTAKYPEQLSVPVILYCNQEKLAGDLKHLTKFVLIRRFLFHQPRKPRLTIVSNRNAFEQNLVYNLMWDKIILFIFESQNIQTFKKRVTVAVKIPFRIPVNFMAQKVVKPKTHYWIPSTVNDGELKYVKISSCLNCFKV